jgi:hypothetical protein
MYLICTKLAVNSRLPLAIYRRHSPDCQFYGRPRRDSRRQRCQCPIWVQGRAAASTCAGALISFHGRRPRTECRVGRASGEVGIVRADIPNIADAVDRFFDDARARGLADATIGKLNVLLRKQPWCRGRAICR